MSVSFSAQSEFLTFHDPMQSGKLTQRKTEIRFDPLTGETSRLIFDPGAPFIPFDYTELAKQTANDKCPFCTQNVLTSTPTFPEEVISGGRLIKGEAVAFPNLFPYSKHNAVICMCHQHFVTLEEFTETMIANSLSTAFNYLTKVIEMDSTTAYASVNWNYLPPSGGSILHPHIHVLASEHPTNYQATVKRCADRFALETNQNFYNALLTAEKQLDERWIGEVGSISWVHAFAPKSHCDFIGIVESCSFHDLGDDNWRDVAKSLIRFFSYFRESGIASFNLGLFIPLTPEGNERVHIRLIPRMTNGMLQTSDVNVFNFLHNEPLSLKIPEETTKRVSTFFSG